MMRRTPLAALLLGLATAACASGRAPSPAAAPPSVAAVPVVVPGALRWFRASAERRAAYLQAYRLAGEVVTRRAGGLAAGSWAVVLDGDETVLDNAPYEQGLVERGATYDSASWNAWVRRGVAADLPGAIGFTALVRQLGGRVVIVTNRDEAFCAATRANLVRARITADEVLCRTDRSTDSKDPRFDAVARGVAPSVLPPLRVVMWVGDNIQDFPHTTQAVRTAGDEAFGDFGERFFVLPNPMYGSWEHNPLPPR